MSVSNVQLFSAHVETTFNTDEAENYIHLRPIEGTYKPRYQRTLLPNRKTTARLHDGNPNVHGSEFGCGFEISFYLEGLGEGLGPLVAYSHPQSSICRLLRALMGGQSGDSGSTIIGGTAVQPQITDAHGSRFPAGQGLIASSQLRYNLLTGAGGGGWDEINVNMAFSAAPSGAMFNTATFYLDEDEVGGSGDTLACRILNTLSGDRDIFRGCCGTFTLTTELDGLLVINVNMQAASWEPATGDASTALAASETNAGGPIAISAGRLLFGDAGVTTYNFSRGDKFTFDPGMRITASRGLTPDGSTIWRWRMLRAAPTVTIEWDAYEGATEGAELAEAITEWQDDSTVKQILAQFGTDPIVSSVGTGVVGVSVPRAYYNAPLERIAGDDGGLVRYAKTFRGIEDQATTRPAEPNADLAASAFRVFVG
jgi:hypothetical protein